jgi:hypothetical protein
MFGAGGKTDARLARKQMHAGVSRRRGLTI